MDLSKINIGTINFVAPSTGKWFWSGGNHVLLGESYVNGASIGDIIEIGPYRVRVLKWIPEQNSYLCKRV